LSSNPQMWSPPLRQGSVSDLIAQRILDLIASDQIRPGERLPAERELAALLGTSRPSVREALRSLSARGYVDIRHGAGVFVTEPATTRSLRSVLFPEEMSLAELFDMREVLELPAAAWAARNHDPQRLATVGDAYEALQEASLEAETDWRRLRDLDAAFHMRIVEAAGNRFLTRTLGVLQEMLSQGMETTLRVPGRMEKSRLDHQRILNALLAGDGAAARRAAAAHIRAARQAAFARLREERPEAN
jgi:GntR family transcriptional regulator, transcriptional repressor for pyruvate dehydrogenase complex